MTPSIEQMADNLLKIRFKGTDNNKKNKQGTNDAKEGSGEGGMEKEVVIHGDGTNTPIMTSRKKGMWHRRKRDAEEESKGIDTGNPIVGKRDIGEAEMVDTGASKKLK